MIAAYSIHPLIVACHIIEEGDAFGHD